MILLWSARSDRDGRLHTVTGRDLRQLLVTHGDVQEADSLDDAISKASRADATVLHILHLTGQDATNVAVISNRCPGGVVVVVPPRVLLLRDLVTLGVTAVLLEEEVRSALTRVVQMASIERRLEISAQKVRKVGSPGVFAAAIAHVLQRTSSPIRPVSSIDELTETIGCSPRYLRNLAAAHGINLGKLIRDCRLLGALRLRTVEPTWERVAARSGYRSASGLSEAFNRRFGFRLRDLDVVSATRVIVEGIEGQVGAAAAVGRAGNVNEDRQS